MEGKIEPLVVGKQIVGILEQLVRFQQQNRKVVSWLTVLTPRFISNITFRIEMSQLFLLLK